MRPPLADVVARARGLSTHLLSNDSLRRLAHFSGSGPLAGAIQAEGYWPATDMGGPTPSVVEAIDAAIEHESARRFGVLARWLGGRRVFFAGVFEYEERRAIRFWLSARLSREDGRMGRQRAPEAATLSHRLCEDIRRAPSIAALVQALQRAGNAYAAPLESALREHGEDRDALEAALDRSFAARSLSGARRLGGRLTEWVRDGIDLENAWSALAGAADRFVDGGRSLDSRQHDAVVGETTEAGRRRRLEQIFAGGSLAHVFNDLTLPTPALESRARFVRIANEHRAARIDPLSAAPILEFVMRLRAERADLRRINWGVALGRPADVIISQLARRS